MSSALVDGALKGFSMMERHSARINGEKRQEQADIRNEDRYQDNQNRLASIDKQSQERYQDGKDRQVRMDEQSDTRHQETLDYRKGMQSDRKEQVNWQQSFNENTQQWKKDQQLIGAGWAYFRENGQVAPEHEEMFQRNSGYDPRTFQNPEMRSAVKGLSEKMQQAISSGKIREVNSPDTIKLFDTVFKNKFSSSVGKFDYVVGAEIQDVSFAGFVPVEGEGNAVSFALKVTYDNGKSEVKPMTQGRSVDKDDPVLQMTPKELIQTIQGKMTMADMIERPDYWDKMGGQFRQSRKQGGQSSADRSKAAYQKESAKIESDRTDAIAKVQSDADPMATDETRNLAMKRVDKLFNNRKSELEKSYGIKSTAEPTQVEQTFKSKVDGISADDVINKFMSVNEGMTKEQAIALAKQQGHISDE